MLTNARLKPPPLPSYIPPPPPEANPYLAHNHMKPKQPYVPHQPPVFPHAHAHNAPAPAVGVSGSNSFALGSHSISPKVTKGKDGEGKKRKRDKYAYLYDPSATLSHRLDSRADNQD